MRKRGLVFEKKKKSEGIREKERERGCVITLGARKTERLYVKYVSGYI